MIIAWKLSSDDGGAFFFEDRRSKIFCPICGTLLDMTYLPIRVRPRRKLDISTTYDNRTIVSDSFRSWCIAHNSTKIAFRPVCKDPPFFLFEPLEILRFNVKRAKTRFENRCSRCGNYESVIGIDPPGLLEISGPVESGIFRTDVEFGSRWEKSPIIIVGVRMKELMEAERFRGVDFDPIRAE